MRITRRDFGKLVGAAGAGTIAATGVSRFAIAQAAPKVVIVGGGAGGATVAHFLKKDGAEARCHPDRDQPDLQLLLLLQSLSRRLPRDRVAQSRLPGTEALGIKVVQGTATDVDTSGKTVKVGGRTFPYDKLVLSPGIDIKFDSIPGYSREAALSCRTPTTRRSTASAC